MPAGREAPQESIEAITLGSEGQDLSSYLTQADGKLNIGI